MDTRAGKGRETPGGVRQGRPRMLGGTRLTPRDTVVSATAPAASGTAPVTRWSPNTASDHQTAQQDRTPKTRILFVCIGNSCRSQMAEAFARAYGEDVAKAASAGISPANIVQPLTIKTLAERGISAEGQFAKPLDLYAKERFDLVVNISGRTLPLTGELRNAKLIAWQVQDPIGLTPEVYHGVSKQLEDLVMRLLLDLRRQRGVPMAYTHG